MQRNILRFRAHLNYIVFEIQYCVGVGEELLTKDYFVEIRRIVDILPVSGNHEITSILFIVLQVRFRFELQTLIIYFKF